MPKNDGLNGSEHRVLAYVAELELEVDRLRKHGQLLYQDASSAVHRILQLTQGAPKSESVLAEIESISRGALELIRTMRIAPGYHPSYDQVVDIAFQPIVEKVFRWQQRLTQLPHAILHLELQQENLEWFPARLSHILDNLIANALEYSDPDKGEIRVIVGLRHHATEYEVRISDNGLGIHELVQPTLLDLSRRVSSNPRRPGVGLAIVRMLIEESGGTLTIQSNEHTGTSVIARLPRFDLDDFLTASEQASASI